MTTSSEAPLREGAGAPRTILPCNFRSAGRLSNESARTLNTLHEVLARNLMNSLDVYLGTGLEVRIATLDQMSMEEYRAACQSSGYIMPCAVRPSSSTMLLEVNHALMFTIIDLLLGGPGAKPDATRELTEIDEEIMEGFGVLVAQQIERVWQPVGFSVDPGRCVKVNLAHKVFPPTEKVLRIRFDVSVAGMTGALYISFPASLGGHLVRNVKADPASKSGGSLFKPVAALRERMLDCEFVIAGEVPNLRVPIRSLAGLKVGSVLKLPAPVSAPGKLTLENHPFFHGVPVRQGDVKAMQLQGPIEHKL